MLTVILTGGASRRMGADKATLPLRGETMSALLIKKYAAMGSVAVSVNAAGRFPHTGAIELVDRYPGSGPINGIVSAFLDTREDVVFLTATDLPNGDITLAGKLIHMLRGFDACVIGAPDMFDPLFGVYSRNCLSPAIECLESGRRSFGELFKNISVNYVNHERLDSWNVDSVLLNVNTPEEYNRLTACN